MRVYRKIAGKTDVALRVHNKTKKEVIHMKRFNSFSMLRLGVVMFLLVSVKPSLADCPVNMAEVGPICVDKYEVSVWSESPDAEGNPQGIQFGVGSVDYPCSGNGNNCSTEGTKMFAVSAPGEIPTHITWFQAQQACANVGKRLLRNGEWQMAAAGTPDITNRFGVQVCNTSSISPWPTGSQAACVSNWGVLDMVGNVPEWVEDWIQPNTGDNGLDSATGRHGNDGIFGIDDVGPPPGREEEVTGRFPAALIRGGRFDDGKLAGVFALDARLGPFRSSGFRCAK